MSEIEKTIRDTLGTAEALLSSLIKNYGLYTVAAVALYLVYKKITSTGKQ